MTLDDEFICLRLIRMSFVDTIINENILVITSFIKGKMILI